MVEMNSPNIVIVIADDTTPSFHGCYGGPTLTPAIDALAAAGLRMTRGYCCASLCSPSRYSIFTGRYTQRSPANLRQGAPDDPALVSQTGELVEGQATLATVLREQGYLTGHFGKWHCRFETESLGFPEPNDQSGDPDDPAVDARLRVQQQRAQEVVKRCAGFEVADRIFWGNIDGMKGKHPHLDAHNPAWITDGALDFLDRAAAEKRPFYLHVANTAPHTPDCHLSLGKDHRYTWGGKLEEAPRSHPEDGTVFDRLRAAGLPTEGPLAGVNAGQMMIDDQIAALVAKLREMGELENTIFVYTADHGLSGKGSCHYAGQHLPLVIHWPAGNLRGGRPVCEPFSWVHIAPTLAEACGTAFPAEARPDGVSLLAALRADEPWPEAARIAYHEMGWSRSVIKGRYHYIATRYPAEAIESMRNGDIRTVGIGHFFDDLNGPFFPDYFEPEQLYDIELDPFERNNVLLDPTRAAVLADLREELARICATLPRPFPREPHPFQLSPEFRTLLEARRAAVNQIRHYPTKAPHIPTIFYGNYNDPDL